MVDEFGDDVFCKNVSLSENYIFNHDDMSKFFNHKKIFRSDVDFTNSRKQHYYSKYYYFHQVEKLARQKV